MGPFRVYLFDVDGTLLDSAQDICEALRETLRGHPVDGFNEALVKRYIGYHLLEFFRAVLPTYSEQQHWELVQRYREIYPTRQHRLTRVYPGVPEMLAELPGRKGTATTKSTATVRAVLEQFGLLRYFDHPQGTDGFPAKPAPDVIHAALAALGARPEECLLVGDSPADMEAGRRAGVRLCAVRYGYGDPAVLARFEPEFWISHPRELLSVVPV
ncbi:MAG: HAD-IA family hydrolase [Bryobacterales bacterium]|nr:HAD-IA family hydrolase [Bryobacteraceae bacterium]MDW8130295.1 HAD-IA family hydrolase [Bryobacterales bacterium]